MQTYLEKERSLSALLEQAQQQGEVRIQREDGLIFVLKPEPPQRSPLDVPGVDLGFSAAEIVEFIHGGRKPF